MKGDNPMHHRLTSLVTAVALLGAPLTMAGAALLASAGLASAATGSTNVCSSSVGTANAVTGVNAVTLSGCHQQGSGTVDGFIDPNHPFGPNPGTIHWASGNATSHTVTTSVLDPSLPCPAGQFGSDVTITVLDGAYAGSNATNAFCSDVSGFPIIHTTNLGPVVI
jgi:hypothetical protein